MSSTIDLARRCQSLVARLHQTALDPPSGEGRTASCDHLLTTAALISCLAHDHPERNALRLAALVHALPDEQRQEALAGVDTHVQSWVALLRRQDHELEQGEYPDPAGMGDLERLLTLAHLAASPRREIDSRDAFSTHPLATDDLRVELVYGGATKIKGYVFESARLPEIRGASAILDHINRIDLPALWGQEPALDTPCAERQRQRYDQVRRWFAETFGMSPLDAPECVLYAGGGNILALAPAGWGHRLATAIERRYTEETLVANSVGVWESFRLLELQYGRCPDVFWIDDAEDLLQKEHHKSVAGFLRQSLGDAGFKHKKGFGELVTLLTAKANSRRAGNDSADDSNAVAPRPTAFIELISAARKCSSCDVRPVQPDSEYAHYQRQLGSWDRKGSSSASPVSESVSPGIEPKRASASMMSTPGFNPGPTGLSSARG
ncbi:MAG: hypothetical protein KatS3mg057_1161 [Herpetosiphonaceae bacterium]|nr:MAG: hypothetical protein KatS3mg057_1161 [Herpetosiphonaceae bacterium]